MVRVRMIVRVRVDGVRVRVIVFGIFSLPLPET